MSSQGTRGGGGLGGRTVMRADGCTRTSRRHARGLSPDAPPARTREIQSCPLNSLEPVGRYSMRRRAAEKQTMIGIPIFGFDPVRRRLEKRSDVDAARKAFAKRAIALLRPSQNCESKRTGRGAPQRKSIAKQASAISGAAAAERDRSNCSATPHSKPSGSSVQNLAHRRRIFMTMRTMRAPLLAASRRRTTQTTTTTTTTTLRPLPASVVDANGLVRSWWSGPTSRRRMGSRASRRRWPTSGAGRPSPTTSD